MKYLIVLFLSLNLFSADLKILFIGNSYTAQVKGQINNFLKKSSHKNSELKFINPGGWTLKKHLANPKTVEIIKTGKWHYVVLQDQSQTPALPGKFQQSFHDSAKELCKIIKAAGAKPVFYMTWGRRDGDKRNKQLFPDYGTMQTALTKAYEKAGEDNKATVAPVGLVWRKAYKGLGKNYTTLYKGDGSHPGKNGAFLVACVFFKTIFKDKLDFVKPANDEENLIKKLALE